MDFKIDLSSFLERKGINQTQLANLIGTSPANVNRWATGFGVPSHSLCARLLQEGMTVKELFGIDLPDGDVTAMDDDMFERKVKEIVARAMQK